MYKVRLLIVTLLVIGLGGCVESNRSQARNLFKDNHYLLEEENIEGVENIAFYGEDLTSQEEQELLAKDVVYFGFDKYNITPEYQKILLAHAKHMLANKKLTMRIDGHTDSQGSKEYNVALGERRAKAVAKVLEFKGVSKKRIVVVSYGKEKPAVLGDDEESWRFNRRSEIVYEEGQG